MYNLVNLYKNEKDIFSFVFLLTSVYILYIIYIYREVNMEIIISNSSNVPIYEQIKEQIKSKIITNELKTGELLPSIRALAHDLICSVITTKKAYEVLEQEGYVKTVPAKGIYVTNINLEIVKEEQLKKMERLLDEVVVLSKMYNIKREDIDNILDILYEESK